MVDSIDLGFVFDRLPNSENARFGRLAELSAPEGIRFGRLWRDFRFHLGNFESEANLIALLQTSNPCNLCCQALDSSSHFST